MDKTVADFWSQCYEVNDNLFPEIVNGTYMMQAFKIMMRRNLRIAAKNI